MRRRGGEPTSIHRVLRDVLGRLGGSAGLSIAQVREAFDRVVPDELRGRVRVVALQNGRATVECDSAALAYELRGFLGEELLGRLRREAGGEQVRGLKFKVGANPE